MERKIFSFLTLPYKYDKQPKFKATNDFKERKFPDIFLSQSKSFVFSYPKLKSKKNIVMKKNKNLTKYLK